MMVWLLIVGLLIMGIVIVSVVQLVGARRRLPSLKVLNERYARGEINRDEYLQKKYDILE
jgi:putative membrane protein